MPSTMRPRDDAGRRTGGRVAGWCVLAPVSLLLAAGCAHVPNQFREDGPSVAADWDTPTSRDVVARVAPPGEAQTRDWEPVVVSPQSGAVTHWPLYLEDPFVDKGDGRTDATHPHDVHRLGWEDYVAMPYGLARFTANWLLLPISVVVTPPWTLMESDGRISRQLVWYDHDAAPVRHEPSVEPAEPAERAEPAPAPSPPPSARRPSKT